jgi:hypothetical protein
MSSLAQGLEIVTRCFPGAVIKEDHRNAKDIKATPVVRQLSLLDTNGQAEERRASPSPKKPKAPGCYPEASASPQRRPL